MLRMLQTHVHDGEHDVGPVVQCDDDKNGDEGVEHVIEMEGHALRLPHLDKTGAHPANSSVCTIQS